MYSNRPRRAAEGILGAGYRETRITAYEWCTTPGRSEKSEKPEVILLLFCHANWLVVLVFVLAFVLKA